MMHDQEDADKKNTIVLLSDESEKSESDEEEREREFAAAREII